jgi:hypothetical protein
MSDNAVLMTEQQLKEITDRLDLIRESLELIRKSMGENSKKVQSRIDSAAEKIEGMIMMSNEAVGAMVAKKLRG